MTGSCGLDGAKITRIAGKFSFTLDHDQQIGSGCPACNSQRQVDSRSGGWDGERNNPQTDQQYLIDRPAKPLMKLATGELGDFDFGLLRGRPGSERRSSPESSSPPDRPGT